MQRDIVPILIRHYQDPGKSLPLQYFWPGATGLLPAPSTAQVSTAVPLSWWVHVLLAGASGHLCSSQEAEVATDINCLYE